MTEKWEALSITTNLRKDYVKVPEVIQKVSGITINGKRIKSLLFSTDISIIMNNNADAVLAVHPFTPHPAIIQSITGVSAMPVMAGVGGGTTQGSRCANMAMFAEAHGCLAAVANAPTPIETIEMIDEAVDIPIIMTVVSEYTNINTLLRAGVDILNVSGAKKTESIVRNIRKNYPTVPIIATGGPTDESVKATIESGANAITYTPPENGKLFSEKMKRYRKKEKETYQENE